MKANSNLEKEMFDLLAEKDALLIEKEKEITALKESGNDCYMDSIPPASSTVCCYYHHSKKLEAQIKELKEENERLRLNKTRDT